MIEIIGWVAAVCFTLSGLPLLNQAIKTGRTPVPLIGIILTLGGFVGMLIVEILTDRQISQLADFTVGTVVWLTLFIVKLISYGEEEE